ncbi:hypothetical protein P7C73_g3492, partial [Tremellales sp. Uapishka_1]
MILPSHVPRDSIAAADATTSQLTSTITINPTSTSKTSASGATVAGTSWTWWELLCLIVGAVFAVIVGSWVWWRHRKKKKEEAVNARELIREEERTRAQMRREQEEEEAKELEKKKRKKKGRGRRSESESDSSESYDSVSDGGTIRPRRRRRGGRRRDRGYSRRRRRDDTESESEDSYWSDETYYPRRRRGRRKEYPPPHRKRGRAPPSSSTASPSPPPLPKPPQKAEKQEKSTFRDSVFSSYTSMKKAAVRLKYVEAKVNLKKKLKEEENIEVNRRKKIDEANAEIAESRRLQEEWQRVEQSRREKNASHSSRGSNRPLIPPVAPSSSYPSSASSSPPPKAPPPAVTHQRNRQPVPGKPPSELGTEIHQLLGTKPKRDAQPQSIYLEVTKPKDRLMIPKGGLAPAPPGRAKASPSVPASVSDTSSVREPQPAVVPFAGIGAGGGKKWADRLRERR